jgi:hypothetical protein
VTLTDRAIDAAARKYPGFTSYESVQRAAYARGYLAGWCAAKRKGKR